MQSGVLCLLMVIQEEKMKLARVKQEGEARTRETHHVLGPVWYWLVESIQTSVLLWESFLVEHH